MIFFSYIKKCLKFPPVDSNLSQGTFNIEFEFKHLEEQYYKFGMYELDPTIDFS